MNAPPPTAHDWIAQRVAENGRRPGDSIMVSVLTLARLVMEYEQAQGKAAKIEVAQNA